MENSEKGKGKGEWVRISLCLVWLVLAAIFLYWSYGVFGAQLSEMGVNPVFSALWCIFNLVVIFASMFVFFMLVVSISDVFKFHQHYTEEEAEAQAFAGRD